MFVQNYKKVKKYIQESKVAAKQSGHLLPKPHIVGLNPFERHLWGSQRQTKGRASHIILLVYSNVA